MSVYGTLNGDMTTRRRERRWTSAAARRIIEHSRTGDTVEEAVRVIASRLLQGVSCPPTDLGVLKGRLNVMRVEPVARLPISGELRKQSDGLVVVHSSSLSPARRRFTIAHELGHAVFESTGRNCPRYGRELERICDMLAAEFLMPSEVFMARAGERVHPGHVLRLARDFATSVAATALRCRELLGVSVFQVEAARVSWGYGVVRGDGDLRGDAYELREAVGRAMGGGVGESMVLVRQWPSMLRWLCMRGEQRALFVLQRMNRRDPVGVTPGRGDGVG